MADEDFGTRNWPLVKLIAEWISCAEARSLTIRKCWYFSGAPLSLLVCSLLNFSFPNGAKSQEVNFRKEKIAMQYFITTDS